MEQRIATTIDQSKQLLDAGLGLNTADMRWALLCTNDKGGIWELQAGGIGPILSRDHFIPAWSLQALMNLMPRRILVQSWDRKKRLVYKWYSIRVDKVDGPLYDTREEWRFGYRARSYYYQTYDVNPVNAAFNTVLVLLSTGHIEKGGAS